jgi:hypothetical protein
MTRPDEAMEKVMAGLRDVEAPVGMERRILERLENVAEVRGRADWRQLWPGRTGVVWGLGCGVVAATILIALAIPVVHRRGPVAARGNDVGAKVLAGREAVVSAGEFHGKRPVLAGVSSVSQQKVRGVAAVAAVQGDEDSVAMSEMRAASFPAPPMPLTDEEKLLLRMVHQGGPVELAMLDPRLEALRDAEEKADFQRFFAKPVMKQPAAEQAEAIQATPEQPAIEQEVPMQSTTEQPVNEQAVPMEPATEQPAPAQVPAEEPKPE